MNWELWGAALAILLVVIVWAAALWKSRAHIDGLLRGHPIAFDGDQWIYEDTGGPTEGNERNCGHCGKANDENGHDGCLGVIPGVVNACCGHGNESEAYIQFSPDCCIRGADAVKYIDFLKKHGARSD